ncbi:hypothetical protein [Ligilactobacillus equi]|uniref:IQ motif-containing GTPase-activating protein n=2 Tax=Ligilactobacillus equi TaxID=137357 RepID=V7HX80_9LACO|nr:hypothetical protein [Ligilactobacillus equi]ETA74497.1 IQ motif-containing GTPase-activating protein [Ligilactobacillus equi DPC 6820]KRL78121.1 hypothetical protein FC36_GL001171 [Ligilactobacillus equi DSM 15833 = JCM 10991]
MKTAIRDKGGLNLELQHYNAARIFLENKSKDKGLNFAEDVDFTSLNEIQDIANKIYQDMRITPEEQEKFLNTINNLMTI